MTYEDFKLCIIQQAAGTAHYPNVLNALQQAVANVDDNVGADDMLAIAYAVYCLTHGFIEE